MISRHCGHFGHFFVTFSINNYSSIIIPKAFVGVSPCEERAERKASKKAGYGSRN